MVQSFGFGPTGLSSISRLTAIDRSLLTEGILSCRKASEWPAKPTPCNRWALSQLRPFWLQNPGDPQKEWQIHVLKANWPRANQVIAADLNGDRRLDVIAGAERGSNEVRWWRNEGSK